MNTDLLGVRKQPLTPGMLADLLGHYLRCEPTVEPFALPSFRVEDLCEKACSNVVDDASMLESIAALYALCMYHAVSASFPPQFLRRAAGILMTVVGECIAALELSGKISIAHPAETIEYQRFAFATGDIIYDTFRYCLNLSREILREIARPVRLARDKSKQSVASQKPPVHAVQPHTILFMCSFSLCHIATILSSSNQLLSTIPGLVETLILLMSLRYGMCKDATEVCSVGTSMPVADENEKLDKNLVTSYFTVKSMELVSRLSCAVVQLVLNDNILKEVFYNFN